VPRIHLHQFDLIVDVLDRGAGLAPTEELLFAFQTVVYFPKGQGYFCDISVAPWQDEVRLVRPMDGLSHVHDGALVLQLLRFLVII